MKKLIVIFLSIGLVLSSLQFGGRANASGEKHDVELWNTLKPLETTVTFLNTGAHPDDERSDFLAYLSRGLGVTTASLIANRGEGGQNEIGSELDNALGIIRSREMIEASKITGVKSYHLSKTTSDPIYDFGFSKTPEETLEKWGEDLTYERLIRFIRTYQPDILMPSFRNDHTQHGHHRAMEILSERAFEDAANPNIYPQQLKEGLSVWQVKKLFLPAESQQTATTSIEIGMLDPVYNMSYPQLGEESRYMHKSQGMGNDIPVAPRQTHLELLKASVDTNESNELFAGVPYDLAEWAQALPKKEKSLGVHFTELQKGLDKIVSAYPNRNQVFTKTQTALDDVRKLTKKTNKAKLDEKLKKDLLHKLSIKEDQLETVSLVSSNLEVSVKTASNVLTKGEKTAIKITLKNKGKQTLKNMDLNLILPKGWKVQTGDRVKKLSPGERKEISYQVSVPKNAQYYHAYDEPAVQINVNYKFNGTQTGYTKQLEETVAVLPDLSLSMSPKDVVVNTANVQKEIPVTVKVKNYQRGKNQSSISLDVPDGWKATPKKTDVAFSKQHEEKDVAFKLTPPKGISEGKFQIAAKATANGKTYSSTIQEIKYDHIGTFYYQYPAQIDGVAFELLQQPDLKIGYIDSGFDTVADSLRNTGLNITELSESDLATGNLSQYDTIVTGIRAYLSREDLKTNNARLMKYVEDGGHLVVQYHKPNDGWNAMTTAPYPLTIGNPSIRWRVTNENATVNVLQPESPLFNYPNKITEKDWSGWVQERGLYYPMKWDDRFETFVSMADPNEEAFDGGILMANYGKGTYLYTNLVFYRQIQGQVPGGYRIFTNLISYGANK